MINPKISRATLGRAPAYLKFLRGIEDSTANISATTIAKELELGEVQVRKDLRALCGSGKPKTGYKVGELTASLASCLSEKDGGTVIIGAGKLGRALLDYAGFADYGLNILAAFDIAVAEPVASPKGKYNFDYFKYKMPIFGQLIFALDFSRLMKAMLLNLNNGMRIQDAIDVSKNVVQNYVMLSIVETSLNNIIIGESWIEPFEKSGLPKSMVTEMLKIGMQTDLPEMMDKLVEYMEIDIDNIIQKIVKVLPEVTYLFVGIVLIFFVLVVLAPCIEVYMGGFLFSAAGV